MQLIAEQVGARLRENNKLRVEDHIAHDWYRFVLSFPAHLVRSYLHRFGIGSSHTVLDPFCGTGTTLVECKRLGVGSIGIEPNPVAAFASGIKVNWSADPDGLIDHAKGICKLALAKLAQQGISDTRSVYKSDTDDRLVRDHEEIQRIAQAIEARRIELGKTSGFEKLYARVTKLYFGGMTRHLLDLRSVLRPGAQLAYVVGDQASYLRVMVRTGQLLAGIAKSIGYEVVGTDLYRTRLATATKEQLREEVVVLRWPGSASVTGWSQKQTEEPMVKENARSSYKAQPKRRNRYAAIIEDIFFSKYKAGAREVAFERAEFEACAKKLKIALPKNLGDLVYSFRYRANLPERIVGLAKGKKVWVIRPVGKGKYKFALIPDIPIIPNEAMTVTKVPDSTPGVVTKYAFGEPPLENPVQTLANLVYPEDPSAVKLVIARQALIANCGTRTCFEFRNSRFELTASLTAQRFTLYTSRDRLSALSAKPSRTRRRCRLRQPSATADRHSLQRLRIVLGVLVPWWRRSLLPSLSASPS
jgi:SAM-dependent methyltransferase